MPSSCTRCVQLIQVFFGPNGCNGHSSIPCFTYLIPVFGETLNQYVIVALMPVDTKHRSRLAGMESARGCIVRMLNGSSVIGRGVMDRRIYVVRLRAFGVKRRRTLNAQDEPS